MKRMLFNATQAEELRVAIVDGQKLIDLDIESASKEQRKSNIYKGVITRVEPSLEAAFVNYGEERHGFLPFKEISRIYFQPGIEASKARIQDVIKEGQELIVQVEKDERGNKGAALTTFISLAGRYLVLMPNNPRGGGVSRRVEGEERNELREVMDQLQVPSGMSLIARTAAIGRNAEELQWDLNYLMQLWSAIEGAASQQSGPFLIYLEGSLVIRAIRDYFQPDIGEILIDTDDVYAQAAAFMGTVMPHNVSRVKRYHDDVPLFSRFQIEHQIESAYSRQVNLPSGGAVVIDHTEALVACDVNSGRATRGADIEETAFKTNCEAADEIARQLRLRDLGGLIVIDFIDMESSKNQREVENRLRDALRHDRARVQMGKISRFGLMELSRQRLRPALAETSYIPCPRCTGTGHIRSTESAALHILRILEEEAMKDNTTAVHTQVPVDVATFLLNEKRPDIAAIELRHKVTILLIPNKNLETPQHTIVRLRHDDLNQEEMQQPSYRMVNAPIEEVKLPSAQTEKVPPRQQAAVKGVTPEQPAPLVEEKRPTRTAAPTTGKVGFVAKIISWFQNLGSPAPAAPTPSSKTANPGERQRGQRPQREDRNARDSREDRDGGRRGRGRNNRKDEPREESESRQQSREENPQKQNPAKQQQREPRRQRGENRQEQHEAAAKVEVNQVSAIETPPQEIANEENRGRRRGRRGGRRERGEGRPEQSDAFTPNPMETAPIVNDAASSVPVAVVVQQIAVIETPAAQTPIEITPVVATATIPMAASEETRAEPPIKVRAHATEQPAITEPAPVVYEVVAPISPVETEASAKMPVEVAPIEIASTPAPAAQTQIPAPVLTLVSAVAKVPAVIAQPEPAHITAPIAVPTPITPAPVEAPTVAKSLTTSGLILVETAAEKMRPIVVTEPPPVQPRRRRPSVVVSNEPMVMVETHKSAD